MVAERDRHWSQSATAMPPWGAGAEWAGRDHGGTAGAKETGRGPAVTPGTLPRGPEGRGECPGDESSGEVVLLELAGEGGPVDLEHAGCFALVEVGVLQGVDDRLALDLLEAFRLGGGKTCLGGRFAQQHA